MSAQPTSQVSSEASPPVKLILVTMVKNESRIIERLMGSVKGKVDAIVVSDTGSTDNTPELVRRYLADNEIPGALYTFPFETFGKSRTESFHCAQDWLGKQDAVAWPAANCWALLLDGDMMLPADMNVSALKARLAALKPEIAGASLKQENGTLVYSNVRLIRCSEPWICKGATHEAWTCPPSKQTAHFDGPPLKDLNDGGCKSDKYERDERLLLKDLEEMPNDPRTLYYLGQTYLCLRNWPKAIETFKRRIEAGGWDEETYIARVHLGDSYLNSGQEAAAVAVWLEAWESRQHRTEAAIRLVQHYRKKPKAQFTANMFLERLWVAQKGETLEGEPRPAGFPGQNRDLLFVSKRDMEHHFWEELGILSYYKGNQRAAWMRLDEYDLQNSLGWHDFNHIFGQVHWYDWLLKPRRQQRFAIPLEKLPWAGEADAVAWQPFNPSLRQAPDGRSYWLNLRYANYWTEEAKHYHYRAFHGKVLTRNAFCVVPREAGWNQPFSVEEIIVDPAIPKKADHYIQGIEDCRWIQGSKKQEFLGTSQSYSENGTNKIFHVWREAAGGTWQLKQLPLPEGISPQETQKNWMGYINPATGKASYVFKSAPFQICEAETGATKVLSGRTVGAEGSRYSLKEYRGSAGPVAWSSADHPEEKWLMVLHKVYIGGEGRRYYHRFLTLDAEMRPVRLSCFVRMTKERVEYWSGMCPSFEGDSMWITYGVKDSEAYIAEMRLDEIERLLFYSLTSAPSVPAAERLARITSF